MGIRNVNVQATLEAIRGESRFLDIPAESMRVVRFLPTPDENGSIFFRTMNHYGFKSEERGIAPACLRFHDQTEAGSNCYICALYEGLGQLSKEHQTSLTRKLSHKSQRGSIKPNNRFYSQALEGRPLGEGKIKWVGPKLASLPITAVQEVGKILSNQYEMGTPYIYDPDNGQAVYISRTGSGPNQYGAERSGQIVPLDEIFPGWESKIWPDIWEKINLTVLDYAEQKASARYTFPELDWDMLEAEYGL